MPKTKLCKENYATTVGEKPFDWNKFLARTRFTGRELRNASELAGEWTTCACGNQCSVIPRNCQGTPMDNILEDLGRQFYTTISVLEASHCESCGKSPVSVTALRQARSILAKIEKRSTELIAQHWETISLFAKLPKKAKAVLQKYLDEIANGDMTGQEVAEKLGL